MHVVIILMINRACCFIVKYLIHISFTDFYVTSSILGGFFVLYGTFYIAII